MKRIEFNGTGLAALAGVAAIGIPTIAISTPDTMPDAEFWLMKVTYEQLWQRMRRTLIAKRIPLRLIRSARFEQERGTFNTTHGIIKGIRYQLIVRTLGAPAIKGCGDATTYGFAAIYSEPLPVYNQVDAINERDADPHPKHSLESWMRWGHENTWNGIRWCRYSAPEIKRLDIHYTQRPGGVFV